MAQKTKLYITEYEKAVAMSFIAGGCFISAVGLLMTIVMLATGADGNIMSSLIYGIGFLAAGIAVLAFGIYKNTVYRRKKEETRYLMYSGKKITGKIVSTALGSNIKRNNSGNTTIVAECTGNDPETGEERHFYSEKLFCSGSLGGMIVDIYLFPAGKYYIDMDSVRHQAAEDGRKVHDFS